MSIRILRNLAAAALLAVLAACASPGGKLQQSGNADVFDMKVDTSLDWSRIRLSRQEVWTIDGTSLNSLMIYSGVKPGEHVFLRAKERKSRPDGPWFRVGMRPDELRDLVLDGLREQGWADVAAENMRPQSFGSVDGVRFELGSVSSGGLIYKGSAAAAEKDGKLTVLLWMAPAEYYFGRDASAVIKMLDGMQFVR